MFNLISNKNLNPSQKLDLIISSNPTSLVLQRTQKYEIRVFDNRIYDLYHLGFIVATNNEIIFLNPLETELFRKYNAFGLLCEILNCKEFLFEKMFFKYQSKGYETTRNRFLIYGIKDEFDFGDKIFLPLKYFRIHNLEEPTFI